MNKLQNNYSFPFFPSNSKSLVKRYLTKEIHGKLIKQATRYGFTLSDAIRSGVANPDSNIGIYAGDAESYDLFSAIFKPIIADYHAIDFTNLHQSHIAPSISQYLNNSMNLPDPDPERKYIITTRIRVARNLANFPFTPKISLLEREQVERIILKSLENKIFPFKGRYKSISDLKIHQNNIKNKDSKILTDKNTQLKYCFKKGDRFQEAAGINRDWPKFRGVFESNDNKFVVWINEEDHLRAISIDESSCISDVFNRLVVSMHYIEQNLSTQNTQFAWKSDLGYLTACPSNLGTGMRASVHIKLPNLSINKQLLEDTANQLNLQIRGTKGEKTEIESAVFDISNSRRLGVTESECCETLYKGICSIIKLEQQLCGVNIC